MADQDLGRGSTAVKKDNATKISTPQKTEQGLKTIETLEPLEPLEPSKQQVVPPVSLPPIADKPTSSDLKGANPGGYEFMRKIMQEGTDKRKQEEAKRARRRGIISAIGDGVAALANLYYTTKGAPSQKMSWLSDKNKARYDKMMTDYDNEMVSNYNAWAGAKAKDDAQEAKDKAAKFEYQKWKAEQLQKAKDYEAKKAAARNKRNLEAAVAAARIAKDEAVADWYKERDRSGGRGNGRSGSRGSAAKKTWTWDGVTYDTVEEYNTAVRASVAEYNRRHPDDQINADEIVSYGYKDMDSKPRKRGVDEVGGDYKAKIKAEQEAQKKKSPTSTSTGNTGKKSPTA